MFVLLENDPSLLDREQKVFLYPAVAHGDRFELLQPASPESVESGFFHFECRSQIFQENGSPRLEETARVVASIDAEDVIIDHRDCASVLECAWYADNLPQEAFLLPDDERLFSKHAQSGQETISTEAPTEVLAAALPLRKRQQRYTKEFLEIASVKKRVRKVEKRLRTSTAHGGYLPITNLYLPTDEECLQNYSEWFDRESATKLRRNLAVKPGSQLDAPHVADSLRQILGNIVPLSYMQMFVVFSCHPEDDLKVVRQGQRDHQYIAECLDEWLYGPVNLSWLRVNLLALSKLDSVTFFSEDFEERIAKEIAKRME